MEKKIGIILCIFHDARLSLGKNAAYKACCKLSTSSNKLRIAPTKDQDKLSKHL